MEDNNSNMLPKKVTIEVKAGYVDKIKEALGAEDFKVAEEIRTRTELEIMKQVMKTDGNNIISKIDNYNEMCKNNKAQKKKEKNNKYKVKHIGIYGKI